MQMENYTSGALVVQYSELICCSLKFRRLGWHSGFLLFFYFPLNKRITAWESTLVIIPHSFQTDFFYLCCTG